MCATIDSRGQYSDACKQMEYVPAVTVVTCYQHKGRMVTIWRGVTRAIHCHRMLHRGSFASRAIIAMLLMTSPRCGPVQLS